MASPAPRRLTVDELIGGLESSDERLELIDGVVTAMVGGTVASFRIAGNIFGTFFNKLRGGSCRPYGDGMLLRIDDHTVFAPDAMIIRSAPDPEDRYVTDPVVIVGVLLPSTEVQSRGLKWLCYQTLPSLRHYLLVAQDRRRVEAFWRQDDGLWLYQTHRDDPQAEIALPAVGISLTLAEIYEVVTLGA